MMERAGQPVRSAFSDDPEMQQVLQLFVDELPRCVNELSTAFTDNQPGELARIASHLIDSGGGCGFSQISAAARILEETLTDINPGTEEIRQAIDTLVEYCSRAIT